MNELLSSNGLGLDFNFSALFFGFAFGIFGFSIFRKGRRDGNIWQIVMGLGLMIYPYFVSSTLATIAVGSVLLLVAYAKR